MSVSQEENTSACQIPRLTCPPRAEVALVQLSLVDTLRFGLTAHVACVLAELDRLVLVWGGSQTCPSLRDQACLWPPCSPIPFVAPGHGLVTRISSANLVSASGVWALTSLVLGEGRLGFSSFLIDQICFQGGACFSLIYVQKRQLSD